MIQSIKTVEARNVNTVGVEIGRAVQQIMSYPQHGNSFLIEGDEKQPFGWRVTVEVVTVPEPLAAPSS